MFAFNIILLLSIASATLAQAIPNAEPATSTYVGTNWNIDWSQSTPTYRPSAEAAAAAHAAEAIQKAELEAAALAAMPSYNTSKYARMGRARRAPKHQMFTTS